MTQVSFDPNGFFNFDVKGGAVRTRDGSRMIILSDAAVEPLISAAVKHGDLTALRKLGRHVGTLIADGLKAPANRSGIEDVIAVAADVLALFGWGRLYMERWGDALVAVLSDLPRVDRDHLAIAALLGGALSALVDQSVACVPISDDGRFLVVDPTIAEEVWSWSRAGQSLGQIVDRLSIPA